jgi:DnaJ-class molecular chaperone
LYHPDRTGNDETKSALFKEVSEAYHLLMDEEKRKAYDETGVIQKANDITADDVRDYISSSELMKEFLTMRDDHEDEADASQKQTSSNTDHKVVLKITIDDVYYGNEKKRVELKLKEKCPNCIGGLIRTECLPCLNTGFVEELSEIFIRIPIGIKHRSSVMLSGIGQDAVVYATLKHSLPDSISISSRKSKRCLNVYRRVPVPLVDVMAGHINMKIQITSTLAVDLVLDRYVDPSVPIRFPDQGVSGGDLYIIIEPVFPTESWMRKMKPVWDFMKGISV